MGRLRSDGRAVAAIVLGASAGVAGTFAIVNVLEDASTDRAACVEVEAPRVVYSTRGASASVTVAPSGPARVVCTHRVRRITTVAPADFREAEVRVRVEGLELRSRELDRARAEIERSRQEVDRARVEILRSRQEVERARPAIVRYDREVERALERARERRERGPARGGGGG